LYVSNVKKTNKIDAFAKDAFYELGSLYEMKHKKEYAYSLYFDAFIYGNEKAACKVCESLIYDPAKHKKNRGLIAKSCFVTDCKNSRIELVRKKLNLTDFEIEQATRHIEKSGLNYNNQLDHVYKTLIEKNKTVF